MRGAVCCSNLSNCQEKEGDVNDESSSSDDDARKRNHLGGAKHRKRHRVKYKLAVLDALAALEKEHVVGAMERLAAEVHVDQSQISRWKSKR